ncbi:MAG TPA: hypothetical protein VKY85_09510 [Candidatus Angelobacter sp.]|nr:hypothetical protein [Candidatus Angelobacter sp.]
MSIYTIVKYYKVYEGVMVSEKPMDELDGVQLRGWLKSRGYSYEQAEQTIKQLDDHGSIRVQLPANPATGEISQKSEKS